MIVKHLLLHRARGVELDITAYAKNDDSSSACIASTHGLCERSVQKPNESFEESGELTPGGRATSLAFSPRADGLLAVGGAKVELFDYASKTLVREIERCTPSVDEVAFSPDGAMLAVAEKTSTDSRNGRVAIYLRSPDDVPVREPAPSPTPRPTLMPTSRLTFRPTSSPRDESDGARTASMAWAALLLVAWLA